MLNNIKKFIKKTVGYDPGQKTGQFGSSGSNIENDELKPEPNGYEANANVLNVHPNEGKHPNIDAKTTMSDVVDWHTDAVFDLLGQPQTARPQKNAHRDVDQQLANQYFSNLERR